MFFFLGGSTVRIKEVTMSSKEVSLVSIILVFSTVPSHYLLVEPYDRPMGLPGWRSIASTCKYHLIQRDIVLTRYALGSTLRWS